MFRLDPPRLAYRQKAIHHHLTSHTTLLFLSGGAILLVEALLDDDKRGPVRVHLESLVMLAATGEGKERSGKEYGEMLTKHGFVDVEVHREGTLLDGVLARKPTC